MSICIEKLFFEILIFLKEIKYLVCWIYFIFQVFKFKNGLSLFVSVKNDTPLLTLTQCYPFNNYTENG